jgi:hypothetical protein
VTRHPKENLLYRNMTKIDHHLKKDLANWPWAHCSAHWAYEREVQ